MPAIIQIKRNNQLDGLRLFAMLGVIFMHLATVRGGPAGRAIGWGCLQLFMALSGFLTTRVLLLDRKQTKAAGGNSWATLGQFFMRRVLRTFPIYYLVIGIGLLIGLQPAREVFGWLATYTLNIYLTLTGNWTSLGPYAHLWSLSVQEQFYLFWALVVMFAPKRRLFQISCAMVAVAPIYRLFAIIHGWGSAALTFFTLSCLDSVGMGALLALAADTPKLRDRIDAWLTWGALPVGLVAAVILVRLDASLPSVTGVGFNLALGLIACWIIHRAKQGFRGPVGWVLESKPAVFLGRLSYGLFVYHFFMPPIVGPLLRRYGLDFTDGGLAAFVIYSAATIAVAILSWYLIEAPLNRLKDRLRPSAAPQPMPLPLSARDAVILRKPIALAGSSAP